MSGGGATREAESEEQTCPLRGLSICDGHRIDSDHCAPQFCLCDQEELAQEAGWYGAARGYRNERFQVIASETRHPSRATLSRGRRWS